jgi:hypothetical protein
MRLLLVGVIFISFFLISCEKTTLEADQNLPTNVSFKTQVLPLFHNCYGCHDSGNQPDLRASNAYRSLIDGGYVNTESPGESIVVKKLNSSSHSNYLDSDDKKIILGWITEGAKNN